MVKLIKIETVDVPEEYIKPYIAYINPDKIIDVQQVGQGAFLIDMGSENSRHSVSAEEWARIEPLLTGDSTPMSVLPTFSPRMINAWRYICSIPVGHEFERAAALVTMFDAVDQVAKVTLDESLAPLSVR